MGIAKLHNEVVEMVVEMPTPKHEKKVRKALESMRGVYSVEINDQEQKVTVTGCVSPSKVLKEAKKVSKNAEMWCYQYGIHHNIYAPYEDSITPAFYQESSFPVTSYHSGSHKQKHSSYKHAISYHHSSHGHHSSRHGPGQVLPYDHDYGFHHNSRPPVDDEITTTFSDENPNACSVM